MGVRTVAIFSAFHTPNLGGIEQYTVNLAHTLEERGVHVVVVTNDSFDLGIHEVEKDGVEIYRLPCLVFAGGRFPVPRKNAAFRAAWAQLEAMELDGVLINARFYFHTLLGCDLAHSHGLTPMVLEHGSSHLGFGDVRIDWAVRQWEHGITKLVMLRNPHFYAVSQMGLDWITHFGIKGKGTLHNAVNAAVFRASSSGRKFRTELGIAPDALVAAFTGRLLVGKGTSVLLSVARNLQNQGRDVHVLVAGDGPDRERMEREAPANLHILGRLGREDVAALLLCSDVFLFPSSYPEGMPTSILEAAACGLATIGTDVGGVREIMPDDTYGWVLPVRPSPERVTEILAWCDDNRDELAAMGARCRSRVEREFSWERTADDVLDACELARQEGDL